MKLNYEEGRPVGEVVGPFCRMPVRKPRFIAIHEHQYGHERGLRWVASDMRVHGGTRNQLVLGATQSEVWKKWIKVHQRWGGTKVYFEGVGFVAP